MPLVAFPQRTHTTEKIYGTATTPLSDSPVCVAFLGPTPFLTPLLLAGAASWEGCVHLATLVSHAQAVPQDDRLVHVEELTVGIPE
jgi:hypothetical protein